ncbi:hypothetical protein OTU49_003639, partial [Cherax quadricarinatus]
MNSFLCRFHTTQSQQLQNNIVIIHNNYKMQSSSKFVFSNCPFHSTRLGTTCPLLLCPQHPNLISVHHNYHYQPWYAISSLSTTITATANSKTFSFFIHHSHYQPQQDYGNLNGLPLCEMFTL